MMNSETPFQELVERAPIGIYRIGGDREILYANDAFAQMVGVDTAAELVEANAETAYINPEDWESFRELLEVEGQVDGYEIRHRNDDTTDILLSGRLVDDVATGYAVDVTEMRKIEQKAAEQAAAIVEISVPIVQIWNGVTLATLIGTLDTGRAQQFTEDLLMEITEAESQVALIDITGVPSIDTATAQHLIDTVNAVSLLGSEVVITGINPEIAQTLVHLGLSMTDIKTRSSLSEGLRLALDLLEKSGGFEQDAPERSL